MTRRTVGARAPGVWLWLGMLVLVHFQMQTPVIALESDRAFAGPKATDGVDRYGADAVDLFDLGLTLTQELSPAFEANGLPYQVTAYYTGSGWSTRHSADFSKFYTYFSPATLWGPLGAGWTVHMGKLLSSGWIDSQGYQAGYYDPTCMTNDQPNRRLQNTLVEPSGVLHPMRAMLVNYSVDNSWMRADLSMSYACHGTLSWRTADGRLYEVDTEGRVRRITDLSGNRLEIDYYDTASKFPGGCQDPSSCTYGVHRSLLSSSDTKVEGPILHDPAWPLKEIRDSHGRSIQFILSSAPIGGKYRIVEVDSISPQGTAVYKLNYALRTVVNYKNSSLVGTPSTCDGVNVDCIAPEQRSDKAVGDHINNVPFLVQVVRPDGTTVEFDYYDWGDLKSIRTVTGGVITYKWAAWQKPTEGTCTPAAAQTWSGVKLVGRTVTPSAGSAEAYSWAFEKNYFPCWVYSTASYIPDRNRTIVTSPDGNETVYRFSDFGPVQNVKIYAGKAFRWDQSSSTTPGCGNPDPSTKSCIAASPDGRLLREVSRKFDQGQYSDIAYSAPAPCESTTANWPCESVRLNTRIRQEDTLYLDDPMVPVPGCGTGSISTDWWYDVMESTFTTGCSQSADPKAYYPYARVQQSDWQPSLGYRKTTSSGSALGLTREVERHYVSTPVASGKWFVAPMAWERSTESTSSGTRSALVEYQYDAATINKITKEIHHINPADVPSEDPYAVHADDLSKANVNVTYQLAAPRDSSLALPAAPDGSGVWGLVTGITRTGGDPRTTAASATGSSGVQYDETLGYLFGVPTSRQVTGVSWKSLDATVDPGGSGTIQQTRDSAGVPTNFTYDLMGRVTKVEPGGATSGEYPEHTDILTATKAATSFPAGLGITGQVTWKGPDGANYLTDARCSYLWSDVDGLRREWRQERKLADGSFVEKKFSYGTTATVSGLTYRGGWDRVTFESEWVAKGTLNPPGALRSILFETTDTLLAGRIDPFLRYWRETTADQKVRVITYFGLNSRVKIQGVVKDLTGATQDTETLYYRDHLGRLRVVDVSPISETTSPRQGADAIYDYDLFDNLVKANLVDQVQFSLTKDASGFFINRFATGNADGQVRTFSYDALGRLRSATNPESGSVDYHAYDPDGNLLLSDDQNGTVFWREYDPAGRQTVLKECLVLAADGSCDTTQLRTLSQWVYHNGLETARGSSLGKLLTILNNDDAGLQVSQQEYYYYGLNGRVSQEQVSLRDWSAAGAMGPYYASDYTYGPEGQQKDVTYPHQVGSSVASPTVATYSYAHGLLSSVGTNRAGISATLAYHPSGLPKEIDHGNGTKTTIGADVRGRLATITVTGPGTTGTLWQTGTHRYDGGGNIYEIGESTFAALDDWKFGYDERQRLVAAKLSNYTISYSYDLYGNMTAQTGVSPAGMDFSNRQYVNNQIQDPTYTYDGNGNLRDAAGVAYDYDVRNRLTAAGPVASGCTPPCPLDVSQIRGVYRYEASGLRTMREDRTSGWTTFYLRDLAGEVLSEYVRPTAGGYPYWSRDYVQGAGRQLGIVENAPPSAPGGFVTCAQAGAYVSGVWTVTRTCGQPAGGSASMLVTLDWANNPEADIYGYRVYRACDSGQFNPSGAPTLLNQAVLSTSYFVTTAPSSNCGLSPYYWYAVTAVDRSGKEGPYSTPLAIRVNDTTAPGYPRQAGVDGTTGTTVSLSWSAPQNPPVDLLGYYVRRSVAFDFAQPVLVNQVPTTGTTLTDIGLNCGWTYYYRVTAVDTASNQSADSNQVTAATLGCGGGSGTGGKRHGELRPGEGSPGVWEGMPVVGVAEALGEDGGELLADVPETQRRAGPVALSVSGGEALAGLEREGFASAPHQSVGQVASDWVGYTVHTDHLGSVRRITNASGQLVAKHDYFPFGSEIPPLQKSPSSHRYIGRDWDPETGQLYMMARYAQPSSGGRFVSADPLGGSAWRPESLNRYHYGLNSPLTYLDPYGLASKSDDDDKKKNQESPWQGWGTTIRRGSPSDKGGDDDSSRTGGTFVVSGTLVVADAYVVVTAQDPPIQMQPLVGPSTSGVRGAGGSSSRRGAGRGGGSGARAGSETSGPQTTNYWAEDIKEAGLIVGVVGVIVAAGGSPWVGGGLIVGGAGLFVYGTIIGTPATQPPAGSPPSGP